MPPSTRLPILRRSLGVKLGLLLAVIFALSLGALLGVQWFQRQAMADLLSAESRERSSMMAQVIDLTARPLRDFTGDYAQWDDMVRFVDEPKKQWAAINLDASLSRFGVTRAWVLRVDGSVVYATQGENLPPPAGLPVSDPTLRTLLAHPPETTFFLRLPDRLVELCLSPVLPSEDTHRVTTPRGWFLTERTWDETQLKLLSSLIRCETHIAPPGQPLPEPLANRISLRHPLLGPDRKVVADVTYSIRSEELEITARHNRSAAYVLGLCFVAMTTLAVGSLYFWVLRPLGAIGDSLARNDPTTTAALLQRSDEMGRLARLVETSFAQRSELERHLAERARLGRELHDGAIQTLFAAGMSLAGVRNAVRKNPEEAERIIDGIRDELNSTIRDLRAFINGLEPEAGRIPRFSDAARSVLGLLQGIRPVAFSLQIDDSLAGTLSEKIRLHLLQIVRECASNAVRHSQARTIQIIFRREADAVSLEISDDGGGIGFGAEMSAGRGLANLADRTRELGGTLQLESTPGKGLRLHLIFPYSPGGRA